MNGQTIAYIDQYGQWIWAKTIKQLCEKCGRKSARKQYSDGKDGKSYHTGYIVGDRWFTAFIPYRKAC